MKNIDINFVSDKIESMKSILKNLVPEPFDAPCLFGETHATDCEQVVSALRSGKSAIEVYEILKKYALAHGQEPLIITDKGKVLYVDYNSDLQKILLYIGNREDYLCLDNNIQKQIWVLPFVEKYEFKVEPVTGHVFRTLFKPDQILMTHSDSLTLKGTYIPLLFIHIYESGSSENAKCHERIEWIPEKITVDNDVKKEERFLDKVFASVANNCFPVSGKNQNEAHSSGVKQVLTKKLKPATDPRNNNSNSEDSDKNNKNLLIA